MTSFLESATSRHPRKPAMWCDCKAIVKQTTRHSALKTYLLLSLTSIVDKWQMKTSGDRTELWSRLTKRSRPTWGLQTTQKGRYRISTVAHRLPRPAQQTRYTERWPCTELHVPVRYCYRNTCYFPFSFVQLRAIGPCVFSERVVYQGL